MKKVTISDVAERAQVSNATVSAVINQKSTVKHSTRRRVLQAIAELNYRPNEAARRQFKPAQVKSIGLVIKETHNPYFADIIIGAQTLGREKGYNVVVTSSESISTQERQLVDVLAAKEIDGLIINPLLDDQSDLSHLFDLKRRNIPFVLLESVLGLQAPLVDVDNEQAAKKAITYLIGLGHTRIVHFAGPSYSLHSSERIKGVRRAFSESHLAFSEDDIIHAGTCLEDGYRCGLAYFSAHREMPPTAVTCYNDLLALGLMKALAELGLQVPDDVSIIGYDDIEYASYAAVPLTTMRVPKEEIGAKAAEILIRRIKTGELHDVEKMILQTELVIRESTRALEEPADAETRDVSKIENRGS